MLKIIDNQIIYPYSIAQLRKDNPQVSFPKEMPEERLAEWNVFPVKSSEIPEYDEETHTVEEGEPELVEGEWTQVWNVRELTEDELKARVPESISRRQAKQLLIQLGQIESIQNIINAVEDPIEKQLLQSWWDDSQTFERHHPTVIEMSSLLGWNEQDLDDMFIDASKL